MLPAFLGTYELLYHPPRAWQPATLYRWLLREGRATLLTGAVAVLFVVGRSIGPLSLTHNAAYRPSFTWTQFMLTSRHFAGDFFAMPDWPAWAVLLLWAALAAIAWFTRSRVLGFAWLFLMLSPLPIAFISPRGAAQYYVCVFGWMLYAAVSAGEVRLVPHAQCAASGMVAERERGARLCSWSRWRFSIRHTSHWATAEFAARPWRLRRTATPWPSFMPPRPLSARAAVFCSSTIPSAPSGTTCSSWCG